MVKLLRPLPERLAGVGVLVLGLMWTLGVALANWDQVRAAELPLGGALLVTAAGGVLTVAGIWVGVGAVTWAMARLLGGKARFTKVLFAVSAAAPPLWIAAPALPALEEAFSTGAAPTLLVVPAILVIAGGLGFLGFLVTTLTAVEGFSWQRACACSALTVAFCASYLSLP